MSKAFLKEIKLIYIYIYNIYYDIVHIMNIYINNSIMY